jgi:hypothetical protein
MAAISKFENNDSALLCAFMSEKREVSRTRH